MASSRLSLSKLKGVLGNSMFAAMGKFPRPRRTFKKSEWLGVRSHRFLETLNTRSAAVFVSIMFSAKMLPCTSPTLKIFSFMRSR